MNALKLKFTSGNDIPVERTVVTRTEFEAIVEEFERMTKERDEWEAMAEFWESKATKNKQDAERWRQFMSSVSYFREPLVNAATGEEVADECLYRINWRGKPYATLENSIDAARSAEKQS